MAGKKAQGKKCLYCGYDCHLALKKRYLDVKGCGFFIWLCSNCLALLTSNKNGTNIKFKAMSVEEIFEEIEKKVKV